MKKNNIIAIVTVVLFIIIVVFLISKGDKVPREVSNLSGLDGTPENVNNFAFGEGDYKCVFDFGYDFEDGSYETVKGWYYFNEGDYRLKSIITSSEKERENNILRLGRVVYVWNSGDLSSGEITDGKDPSVSKLEGSFQGILNSPYCMEWEVDESLFEIPTEFLSVN